jgi:hypothetical protein
MNKIHPIAQAQARCTYIHRQTEEQIALQKPVFLTRGTENMYIHHNLGTVIFKITELSRRYYVCGKVKSIEKLSKLYQVETNCVNSLNMN